MLFDSYNFPGRGILPIFGNNIKRYPNGGQINNRNIFHTLSYDHNFCELFCRSINFNNNNKTSNYTNLQFFFCELCFFQKIFDLVHSWVGSHVVITILQLFQLIEWHGYSFSKIKFNWKNLWSYWNSMWSFIISYFCKLFG